MGWLFYRPFAGSFAQYCQYMSAASESGHVMTPIPIVSFLYKVTSSVEFDMNNTVMQSC